jgi:hypothetical protein
MTVASRPFSATCEALPSRATILARGSSLNRYLAREIIDSLSASGGRGSSFTRLQAFTRRDWDRTLNWLHLSGLALQFWDHLQNQDCGPDVPPDVAARLTANVADNRLRTAEMASEFDSLNHQLQKAGVTYAALKGFALVPDFCPDACLRNFTDYDYLVPANDLERAGKGLEALGYVPRAGSESYSVTYFHPSRPPRRVSHLDDMYSPGLAREVELHFQVWDEAQRISLTLPDDFLARSCSRSWEALCFPGLADEDTLIFHALHAFRHILSHWCRLSALYEIAYFTKQRSSDAAFWELFRQRIQAYPRLHQIIGVVFSLASGVFGASLSAAIRACTVETMSPAMALWVQRYGLDLALENFSGNKFSLFLHREFIQDSAAWRDIRRRQLFLLKRPARVAGNPTPGARANLRARWRQLVYLAHVLGFHVPATLQYALELPHWRRMVRRISGH